MKANAMAAWRAVFSLTRFTDFRTCRSWPGLFLAQVARLDGDRGKPCRFWTAGRGMGVYYIARADTDWVG